MFEENMVRFNQQIRLQLCSLIVKGRDPVCVWKQKVYIMELQKGSNAYRSTIAIMILITIILPVYCNIIDALVQVTSLIFYKEFWWNDF